MQGDTGTGATITMSGGFTAAYKEIGPVKAQINDVDATTLAIPSDSPAQSIPGDNPEYQDIACQFKWNGTATPPVIRAIQTITVTAPKENTGSAAAANMAGTGYIKQIDKLPNFQRNQLNVANVVIRYNGDTGPTFTAEA